MFKISPIIICLLVFGFVTFQLASAQSGGITCPHDLRLSAQINIDYVNEYRVNGSGPDLPTNIYTSSGVMGIGESFTWIVDGPGTWSGLFLEWRRIPDVPDWLLSGFNNSLTYECVAVVVDGEESDSEPEPGPPAMNLFDGRFNNHQGRDVAAPVAIYPNGSIKIYSVDPEGGDGWLDVDISEEAIEAAGIPANEPVLLGQGKNHYTGIDIFVYRLPSGEFQINTHYADGKPYVFAWDGSGGKWHFAS